MRGVVRGGSVFDGTGMTVLFDCHVHTTLDGPSALDQVERPFSYQFCVAARNLGLVLGGGVTTVLA
ncbi:hypothetical protein [Nonomuraea aridisoli]|uniref:Uncharacterized protein n=1 Tax=Nonomuraea aridisoli TaxID=2070368 RepID=A0A2W2EXZ5_9ACTN|nr:hypothetical protein [Nonomuraea aridisoli]PZG21739.1 hypothetical protein C1J01_05650 [Nonomuraea aridisoli]